MRLEPVVRSEKPARPNEEEPLAAPQLEESAHSNKDSAKPKINQLINFFNKTGMAVNCTTTYHGAESIDQSN